MRPQRPYFYIRVNVAFRHKQLTDTTLLSLHDSNDIRTSEITIKTPVDDTLRRFYYDRQYTVFSRNCPLRLLIAVPVHNEMKYVDRVLDKIQQFWPDVLVVDDGSTDGTGELLAARSDIRLIRRGKNRGYGQSLIDAFEFADGAGYDWVITMDCDEQHEPEMIPKFIRAD